MRLDLFLKASRLVTRRSVAKELCDLGRVRVNDAPARSSKEVRAGDIIELTRAGRISVHRVEKLPVSKQVSKSDAPALTTLLSEERYEDPLFP